MWRFVLNHRTSIILTILLVSVCAKWLVYDKSPAGAPAACSTNYEFISPRLNCDEYAESSGRLTALQTALSTKVRGYENDGSAKRISIWVRDLTTLQRLGIRETELYAPASLFKVPVMVAAFRVAETQHDFLNQVVTFKRGAVADADRIEAEHQMKDGQEYTVQQLVEQMIRYSDNEALVELVNQMSPTFMSSVYGDLGISITTTQGMNDNIVTARTYANLFRALYDSTYLTPAYSEKALGILADTSFDEGARAGIPEDIKVAHKYGQRIEHDAFGNVISVKLHDCGIVYGAHPYLFCFLTEGNSVNALENIIKTLSSEIYSSLK